MKEFLYPDVDIHLLYNLYEDLAVWVDATIVNNKQNQIIKNEIVKLLHQYFLFELPDSEHCIDIESFKEDCKTLRETMRRYGIK